MAAPYIPGRSGQTAYINYPTAPTGVLDLSCYLVAFEITPSTEDIDVGVFCAPAISDQGRTTYTAVATLLWEPQLYTDLNPHVGQVGTFFHATSKLVPIDATQFIQFSTRFMAQPWGRFEVGQRVEVELPLAVLSIPVWLDTP